MKREAATATKQEAEDEMMRLKKTQKTLKHDKNL